MLLIHRYSYVTEFDCI